MKSAISIVVLFWCAIGSMAEEFILPSGLKVSIEPGSKDLSIVRDYLRLADRISSRLLQQKNNEHGSFNGVIVAVNHELSENFELELTKKRTTVYIPSDFNKLQHNYLAKKRLMATLLLLKSGLSPATLADLDSPPPWILTGSLEYLDINLAHSRDAASSRNYFELRTLDHFGAGITLDDIISGDYVPNDGTFFNLFSQGSESLLSICLSLATAKDNFIKEIIIKSFRNNQSRTEVFFSTIGTRMLKRIDRQPQQDTTISEQEKVRNWFRMIIFTRNINYFYPRDSQEITERLNALLVLSVKIEDRSGKETVANCRLEDLAVTWPQIVNPDRVLNDIRQEILKLQNESPGELLPPLTRIYGMLSEWQELQGSKPSAANQPSEPQQPGAQLTPEQQQALRKQAEQRQKEQKEKAEMTPEQREKHATVFRREILVAIEEFNRVSKRYAQIEQYLLDQEKVHIPAGMRYYYRLKCLDDMDILNRNIWPNANNYLDGLEKEYFKY